MNLVYLNFTILSFIVIVSLIWFSIHILRNKNYKPKIQLFTAIYIALIANACYAGFLLDPYYKSALILNTVYFISTIWLAQFMLLFAFEYSEQVSRSNKYKIDIILTLFSLTDTIALICNIFNPFMYDIELIPYNQFYVWKVIINPVHYIHLLYCYGMVISTFAVYLISLIKAPLYYKRKYSWILFAYALVIFTNFICYTFVKIIDISVPMYALIAAFITHYSGSVFPKKLVQHSLKQVLLSTNLGIISFTPEGNIIFANNIIKKIFSDLDGNFDEASAKNFNKDYTKELSFINRKFKKELPDDFNLRQWHIDNKIRYFSIERELLQTNMNTGTFFKFRDRTEERDILNREIYFATHDPLTGIFNSENFFRECDNMLKREPSIPKYMICSNISNFKLINQYFGEEKGNEVLRKQADLFRNFASGHSIYGRITDDKFAVLVRKTDLVLDTLLNCIKQLKEVADSPYYTMQVHCGVAEFRGKETAHELYDQAKMAMDTGKNVNEKVFFNYDTKLMEQMLVEKNFISEFDNAIINSNITMHLQPIFDRNENLAGAEALTRWVNPISNQIYQPIEFIETLEKSYLIHKLDSFIWDKAAAKLSEWKNKGLENLSIAVNVSHKDIHYLDIRKEFNTLKEKYNFNPRNLKIEFSETTLTEEFQDYMDLFKGLMSDGFMVAIDNFGTGYSSLNLLKDITVNSLKIDSDFLTKGANIERNKIILNFIITTAKALNLEVVTEGIETNDQVEMVRAMGTDYLQGYLYDRPLTVESFEDKYLN